MELDDYHFKFKISVLGDKGVGKTIITDGKLFYLAIINNIGKIIESEESDELSIKTVNINSQGNVFRMQFWEIQSHHKNSGNFFRYCLGSTASIYIFDISKKYTFENIEQWIQENEKSEIGIKILIGNRGEQNNNFNKMQAVEVANKYGMQYFEISSMSDSSQISPIFEYLFQTITSQIPNPPAPHTLLNKGIVLGKKLLNSTKYQLSLCDIATLYD